MPGLESAAGLSLALPFLTAYLLLLITPAPIDIAVASLAAIRGLGKTFPMILGIAAGTTALAAAALLLGASLGNLLPVRIVDGLAVAAMLVLAVRIALSNPFDAPARPVAARQRGLATTGFLISILDPIVAAYFFAGFAGALRPLADGLSGWTIVAVLGLIDLAWFVMIASLMSQRRIRRAAMNWHVALRMTSAGALALLTLARLPAILNVG